MLLMEGKQNMTFSENNLVLFEYTSVSQSLQGILMVKIDIDLNDTLRRENTITGSKNVTHRLKQQVYLKALFHLRYSLQTIHKRKRYRFPTKGIFYDLRSNPIDIGAECGGENERTLSYKPMPK